MATEYGLFDKVRCETSVTDPRGRIVFVDIHRSGREIVKVNGVTFSNNVQWGDSEHEFSVGRDNYEVSITCLGKGLFEVTFRLNGEEFARERVQRCKVN